MAGVLMFEDFVGGPDNLHVESVFPSTQKTYTYNFGKDVSAWTFELDAQTLVVDTVTFVRQTGEPNFDSSQVIGFFAKQELNVATYINMSQAAQGIVKVTLPGGIYTGPILPDARRHVPITVFGVTWSTNDTPVQKETHRWVWLQSWEPDVAAGSPLTDAGYTSITIPG